jgi:hypothetical protein
LKDFDDDPFVRSNTVFSLLEPTTEPTEEGKEGKEEEGESKK